MERGKPSSGRGGAIAFDHDFLEHFGIKGMKWGVRREQARTAAKAASDALVTPDAKQVKKVKSKMKVTGIDSVSNKELQSAIQRMNLEVQYSQLKKAQFEDSYLGKGRKFVGKFLGGFLREAGSAAAGSAAGGSPGSYSWGSPGSIGAPRKMVGS